MRSLRIAIMGHTVLEVTLSNVDPSPVSEQIGISDMPTPIVTYADPDVIPLGFVSVRERADMVSTDQTPERRL